MTFTHLLKRWRDYAIRHRVKIFDLGFVAVLLAVATLFAFEVDVFENAPGEPPKEQTLELDEVLLLSVIAVGGALFYTFRRAREHKHENRLRIAAEREVMNLALHDPLTGLPNRRQFDDALKNALNVMPTAPEAHAVLMLDLNGFKKINDVYGHPVGDQALIHVGARLLRAVRDGDLVARFGGDEFAILARNIAGAEGATTVALRIIEALAAPVAIDGFRHSVSGCIGVALSPHDGQTAEALLRKADIALYRAKAERRPTLRFFEEEMDRRLHERDELERALRAAVAGEGFELRFQPTRGSAGQVVGFEAVPRWRHPTLGELEPDRFFAIAEETGLLRELTERLLHSACAAACGWPRDVRLSFNLPSALIADHAFGLRILAVLGETGLAPVRLNLEIDEGALIRHTEAAQALLGPMRSAGVAIVADNFGTGYSDLQNLHRLKLDGIKIDRTYVEAMLNDRQAAVMVKALIGIGQGLDLSVTADGVGSEGQRAALIAQGCDLGQGELHGGPLSAVQAQTLVGRAGPRSKRASAAD
ncbi:MAG TPA: EAL domain-containing protein [Phenylobacterium sp.]|jgi:diguanylate cyclase (GGDEF)-like protein|nr:EAL domain-containing protein [Phenylobacterium sp.]